MLHVNDGSHSVIGSETTGSPAQVTEWAPWLRFAFRASFLFCLQLTFPYRVIWGSDRAGGRILKQLFELPRFFSRQYYSTRGESGQWGLGSFATIGVAFLIAIAVALLWTWLARRSKRKEYRVLWYWLSLYLRFWVALNMLHYAYVKLYPIQMPLPSITSLHTLFGDYAPYRLYWQHVGIVTWYEIFLGFGETFAASLLFFRRTAAIGAALNVGILYNIAHSNLAYDGSVHVRSGTMALLSCFILVQYVPDIWRLLVLRKDVQPSHYRPSFEKQWQRNVWMGVKVLMWLLFIPGYAYDQYEAYFHTSLSKEPIIAGLNGATGFYNVSEFRLNGQEMPYSPLDPVRWHDAVFEDYSTFTYKTNRALPIRLEGGSAYFKDSDKLYELDGFAGGRVYLQYDVDYVNHLLFLQNKNWRCNLDVYFCMHSIKTEPKGTDPRGNGQQPPPPLVWSYSRPSDNRIVLSGSDENHKEIYVVLDRLEEKQAIHIDSPVVGESPHYSEVIYRRHPAREKSFDGQGSNAK